MLTPQFYSDCKCDLSVKGTDLPKRAWPGTASLGQSGWDRAIGPERLGQSGWYRETRTECAGSYCSGVAGTVWGNRGHFSWSNNACEARRRALDQRERSWRRCRNRRDQLRRWLK